MTLKLYKDNAEIEPDFDYKTYDLPTEKCKKHNNLLREMVLYNDPEENNDRDQDREDKD